MVILNTVRLSTYTNNDTFNTLDDDSELKNINWRVISFWLSDFNWSFSKMLTSESRDDSASKSTCCS